MDKYTYNYTIGTSQQCTSQPHRESPAHHEHKLPDLQTDDFLTHDFVYEIR